MIIDISRHVCFAKEGFTMSQWNLTSHPRLWPPHEQRTASWEPSAQSLCPHQERTLKFVRSGYFFSWKCPTKSAVSAGGGLSGSGTLWALILRDWDIKQATSSLREGIVMWDTFGYFSIYCAFDRQSTADSWLGGEGTSWASGLRGIFPS